MPGVLQTPDAAVAVLEREPHWSAELKWQFAADRVFVRTCSQWREVLRAFDEWPRCLGVIEFEAAPAALLHWLSAPGRRAGRPPVLVVSRERHRGLEWALREAGVASIQTEAISGADFAARCRRLLADTPPQRLWTTERA
jgi:hypothetical protein